MIHQVAGYMHASRVLPAPPGPVKVTADILSEKEPAHGADFIVAAEHLPRWVGRLLLLGTEVRSGGNAIGRSGAVT